MLEKTVKKTSIIATLGPATKTREHLEMMKARGVDFVRINMSHSSIDDLKYFIGLAKKVGIPFILDTEGSQIRTGDSEEKSLNIAENSVVKIYNKPIIGNRNEICLKPGYVVNQLERGDIIYIDFGSLILVIANPEPLAQGFITARAISGGELGRNKAVVIDPGLGKKFNLSPLSPKDLQSINLGMKEGVEYIAASFMRSAEIFQEYSSALSQM